jgi:hypothetical protein
MVTEKRVPRRNLRRRSTTASVCLAAALCASCGGSQQMMLGRPMHQQVAIVMIISDEVNQADTGGGVATLAETVSDGLKEHGISSQIYASHTAYVGSANLTSTALGSGQEWMVKASAGDLPQVIEKFKGTFEGLWNDPEFERYESGSDQSRSRLSEALATTADATSQVFFSLNWLHASTPDVGTRFSRGGSAAGSAVSTEAMALAC